MRKNRLTILMHNGGRLGNQMWLIVAVCAFCLEKGYTFDMRCFFEYQEYFNIKSGSRLAWAYGKIYFFSTTVLKIPESIARDLFYSIFNIWCDVFIAAKKNRVIFDSTEIGQHTAKIALYKLCTTFVRVLSRCAVHLARRTTKNISSYAVTSTDMITDLSRLEPRASSYLCGWLFRDPNGIIKHQDKIRQFLQPRQYIYSKVSDLVTDARKNFSHIVGVHIRLGDVVNEFINSNRVAFSEQEVYKILKQYVAHVEHQAKDICFFVCTDGKIKDNAFPGLNFRISNGNAVEDLWLLSKTDIIIGADSSFAVSASYLGDKAFIVFKRGSIDWIYYKDKKSFFVNKYVERFIY